MRVAQIVTEMELGGAQRFALDLTQRLPDLGHETFLLANPSGILANEARQRLGDRFVPLRRLKRPIGLIDDPLAIAEIAKKISGIGAQLVHTHSSKAGILGRWGAFLAAAPYRFHSIHGFAFHREMATLPFHFYRGLEYATSWITQGFSCDSPEVRQYGYDTGILRQRHEVFTVYPGVDLQPFTSNPCSRRSAKESFGVQEQTPVIAWISCLKPQKDPRTALAAFRLIADELPDAVLLMAGDGVLHTLVNQTMTQFGLNGDQVRLLGWVEDLQPLCAAMDVFLHTAIFEGMPQVYPIAMASRVPIVSTDVEGAQICIRHGISGWVTERRDHVALASHCIDLLKDPVKRQQMGLAACDACKLFTIDKAVKEIDAAYRALGP